MKKWRTNLSAYIGAIFPKSFAQSEIKRHLLRYEEVMLMITQLTNDPLKPPTEEQVLGIDHLLQVYIDHLMASSRMQSTICFASEDSINKTLKVAKSYYKTLRKLRDDYKKYFPKWEVLTQNKEFLEIEKELLK